MAEDKTKKLAAVIRSANASEEYDLSGYGPDACHALAGAAFAKPLPLAEMVRLSFVVGGGKKVRQKYNDGLPTSLCDALRKVGFAEDRAASLAPECAGLFKYQHNTDTDLKTVHVFPKIDPAAAAAAASSGEPDEASLTPADLLTYSEMPTFQRMIAAKCPTFAQRKRALALLKAARAGLAETERKLSEMVALTEEEQTRYIRRRPLPMVPLGEVDLCGVMRRRYDTLDAAVLEEKQAWLSKQLEALVRRWALLTPRPSQGPDRPPSATSANDGGHCSG